jgi:hypothetical protein
MRRGPAILSGGQGKKKNPGRGRGSRRRETAFVYLVLTHPLFAFDHSYW